MRTLIRILVPLLILAGAFFVAFKLVTSRPEAKKLEHDELGALVETIHVDAKEQQIRVRAYGNVIPARQVVLAPEVGGRVNWVHANLVPGTRFAAGEKLLKIDGRDYALAVEQQYAAVDAAQTELEIERSRKKIAEREWEMFEKRNQKMGKADALALREPQLRTATVAVKSAQSGLRRARLAVTKTTIAAPFNAMLQEKSAELGQMVGPGVPVVTLVGTDSYWVRVSVPVARLSWFDIPGVGGNTTGADVEVVQEIGNQTVRKSGKVLRLLGDVDPAGRMAQVLVEIEDPLGLKSAPGGSGVSPTNDGVAPGLPGAAPGGSGVNKGTSGMPLLLGSYVDVTILSRESGEFVAIPREALRDGDAVYVVAKDRTLAEKKVDVLWRRKDTVLLAAGLESGEELIVSPVPGAVEGLKVRTAADSAATPEPSGAAEKKSDE